MGQIRVIDVSNNNGMVDWGQVLASGVAGAIVKCTEGTAFVDGQFIRNWTALGNAGAFRGAYHFARPGSSTPQQQAGRFMGIVRAVKATDILVLDLEVGDGDLSGWALGFLNEVQRLSGLTPWLYSGDAFIRAHLQQNPALAQYPLWLANYRPTPPPCPPPWTSYRLWQHTPTARIPGVSGNCDESLGILDSPHVTEAQAMARVQNPVAAHRRPGAGPEQFAIIARDGSMYCYNGAPYCDAYNAHPELGGSAVRWFVGFAWDDDGWGYTQYADDGARYSWRAQGH